MRDKYTKILRLTVSVITLTILIGIVMPVHASAAILTVPTDYGTIQGAIDAAAIGDTVYVKSGTYYEHLTINKPIVLQGEDKSTTIIDGSGSGKIIYANGISNIVISEITVTNGENGIWFERSTNNLVKNVIVTNNIVYGISFGDQGSSYNTLQNIEVYSNGLGVIGYAGTNNMKLLDSKLYDNTEDGVLIGWSSGWVIENTFIHSNGRDGVGIDTAWEGTIRNCIIYDNIEGIGSGGLGESGITIIGNTIYSNVRGIRFDSNNLNHVVKENKIYDNEMGIYLYQWAEHPSYNNHFYHNDLHNSLNCVVEGNTELANTWDNNYPDGGNYYSDYTDPDTYIGESQTEPSNDGLGDGICDTAHEISKYNTDRYPLMKPWHSDFPYQPPTNQPPVAEASGSYQAIEGSPVTFDASSSSDPDGDVLQYRWDFENDGTWDTEWSNVPTAIHTWTDDWSGSTTLEVSDGELTGTDTATVTISNANPVVETGNDQTINEEDTTIFSGSYTDAGSADTHTFLWDFGDGTTASDTLNPAHVYADNEVYTATLTVTDDNGGVGTGTVTVNVNNVNPTVGEIVSPIVPAPVNTQITTSCTFSDAGLTDTHTGIWNWGDGTSSVGAVSETNGVGTIIGEHTYTEAGVYWVTLTVTDKDGGSSNVTTENYVVIYNPEGGFVTGGGWINSPAGAYVENPDLAGKATFGFVSKYEKGATVPTGKTEFQFKVADLNFKSTSYDWLVVAGSKAKYKGTGTINGEGSYSFMLSAVDGDTIDKFRIKIWEDIYSGDITIYDNEINSGVKIEEDVEPSTVISGGSIVVHKEK